MTAAADQQHEAVELERGLGTGAALAANVIDMVGVGPFITLPLIVGAMGGPQAMLGWAAGALLSICDGMTWSELGTAHPEAGGSYSYLKRSFGGTTGRVFAFLYAWQLLFSAPLSIASGCIGFAQYASWFLPHTSRAAQSGIAMLACVMCTLLALRPIRAVGRTAKGLGIVVLLTLAAVIAVGFTHFSSGLAFDFPHGAFALGAPFLQGLGAGLLVSAYDFWGYYNVCFLGAEVRRPERTIPRAVLGSITLVGGLYLLMTIAVLGVLPWRSLSAATAQGRMYTIAVFAQTAFASHAWAVQAGSVAVVLISLAALASVFALLLGYSRIPYAAALDGNFPSAFAKLHPRNRVPWIATLALAAVALVCCVFRLQDVIASLVVVRILFQFLLQGVAVLLPSHRRARREPGRFRMPLYPLPTIVATAGFLFIVVMRPHIAAELRLSALILLSGAAIYLLRSRRTARAA